METISTVVQCCACGEDFELLGVETWNECAFCWACCESYPEAARGRCQTHCVVCGVRVPVLGDFVSDASGIYHLRCDELRKDEPLGVRILDGLAELLGKLR